MTEEINLVEIAKSIGRPFDIIAENLESRLTGNGILDEKVRGAVRHIFYQTLEAEGNHRAALSDVNPKFAPEHIVAEKQRLQVKKLENVSEIERRVSEVFDQPVRHLEAKMEDPKVTEIQELTSEIRKNRIYDRVKDMDEMQCRRLVNEAIQNGDKLLLDVLTEQRGSLSLLHPTYVEEIKETWKKTAFPAVSELIDQHKRAKEISMEFIQKLMESK